jgi:hypothetical protein
MSVEVLSFWKVHRKYLVWQLCGHLFWLLDGASRSTQGNFRQGSKEQGPMTSIIFISQEFYIGSKAFRWGFTMKTNQIVIEFNGIILEGKLIGLD